MPGRSEAERRKEGDLDGERALVLPILKGVEVSPTLLRKELSKVLPTYTLPSRWMGFDRLPRNANGKIDRPKLREEFQR